MKEKIESIIGVVNVQINRYNKFKQIFIDKPNKYNADLFVEMSNKLDVIVDILMYIDLSLTTEILEIIADDIELYGQAIKIQ